MLALSQSTGVRLAEIGFLLTLTAGVWMVAAEMLPARSQMGRMIVACGAARCGRAPHHRRPLGPLLVGIDGW